jgi:putative thioredoxin
VDADTATFEVDVIGRSRERPIVVDFWADWCGPCHQLTPVLERAADEHDVELVKVDIDANPELAERYGVSGIPAVKAFRNGHVVADFVGARPPAAVQQFFDQLTAPSEVAGLLEQLGLTDVAEALEQSDHERALARLLEEAEGAQDQERRELVRRTMVALFAELGQENPLVVEYRRRLARALY